jgi:ankyrin repeat protein
MIFPAANWAKHPLHLAAMSGNKPEVERLLAAGHDVNERLSVINNTPPDVENLGTPLHAATFLCSPYAAERYPGYVDVVLCLLAHGADVHARRADEGTPLHDAARRGVIRIADVLIAHGADVNSKADDHRRTPLHRAIADEELPRLWVVRMVSFLISRGADVNAVADFDQHPQDPRILPDLWTTPLHLAASAGDVDTAKVLIDAGAAVDCRSRGSSHWVPEGTPSDVAAASKAEMTARYDDVIRLLRGDPAV